MEKMKILLAAVFSWKAAVSKKVALSIFLLILAGCAAGVRIDSDTPLGIPKGYVKFYYLESEGRCPFILSVYSTDNMSASTHARDWAGFPIGWDRHGWFRYDMFAKGDERGMLVVRKPGEYRFMITMVEEKEPIVFKILVQENMVVPIKLSFPEVPLDPSLRKLAPRAKFYKVTFEIEKSFPFTAASTEK